MRAMRWACAGAFGLAPSASGELTTGRMQTKTGDGPGAPGTWNAAALARIPIWWRFISRRRETDR